MHACMPRLAFISITATSWEVMLVFSLSAGCPSGNIMLYSTGIHSKGYPTPSIRLKQQRAGHLLRLVDMLTGPKKPNILVFIFRQVQKQTKQIQHSLVHFCPKRLCPKYLRPVHTKNGNNKYTITILESTLMHNNIVYYKHKLGWILICWECIYHSLAFRFSSCDVGFPILIALE